MNVIQVVVDNYWIDAFAAAYQPWLYGTGAGTLSGDDGGVIKFPNSFGHQPLCCPSRAVYFSGRYAVNNGVIGNDEAVYLDHTRTLPVGLRKAGVHCGAFGKYLNRPEGLSSESTMLYGWEKLVKFDQSTEAPNYFSYKRAENGVLSTAGTADTIVTVPTNRQTTDYATDWFAGKAYDWLMNVPQPFFCYLPTFAAHEGSTEGGNECTPATRHESLFIGETPDRRPNHTKVWPNDEDWNTMPQWLKDFKPNQVNNGTVNGYDAAMLNAFRAARATDEWLKAIRDLLVTRGIWNNTVLLVTTDNGEHWGEHRLRAKNKVYNESTKQQLLVRFPGVANATKDQYLISNTDMAPTICDILGVPTALPIGPDGMSFKRCLTGNPTNWREHIYLYSDLVEDGAGGPSFRAVIEKTSTSFQKYVEYFGNFAAGQKERYDLNADPYEKSNQIRDVGAGREAGMSEKLSILINHI